MPPLVTALLAALPIAALLGLMLLARWSAARAGAAAFVVALAVALAAFGFGDTVYGELGRPAAVGGVLAEGTFAALPILWILWPALGLYHLQQRTGAFAVLQGALGHVAGDRTILVLLVAWFFALFLEGAAGFGTPVALAAPFLVSAGVRPVLAVTLALVGHAGGVTFGAVGTPIVPQMAATGLGALALSRPTGALAAAIVWLLPLVMLFLLRRADTPDRPPRRLWPWALAAGALFAAPYLLLSQLVGPELPTLGGALVGGAAFVLLWRRFGRPDDPPGSVVPGTGRATLLAAAPYLLVVALVLATRLVPPLKAAMTDVTWSWRLAGHFSGTVQPLQHPGTLLLLSLALGALVQRATLGTLLGALGQAARQLLPAALALLAVLAVSRLMVHAQMVDALARSAIELAGPVWPLLAPFVGVLGSFVTGSATASNILFSDFQEAAALEAGLPVPRALAAQGFGGASGNMIAPLNLLAGAATVGAVGQEDRILRGTLAVCLGVALLGGALTWAWP